jgi:hypothetical protein
MRTEFRNEPFTDFSKEENAQAMRNALEKVGQELGREYPLVIGGERLTTDSKLDSFNPANRTQLVGRFNKAAPSKARAKHSKRGAILRPPNAPSCCFAQPKSCANVSTSSRRG